MNNLEAQNKKNADLALIREFAGHAIAGIMASPMERILGGSEAKVFAIASFAIANAMLEEYKSRYGVE